MRRFALYLVCCSLELLPAQSPAGSNAPVRLALDTTEAVAALRLLADPSDAAGWRLLYGSAGYRRLAAREAAMGRPMTDSAFAAFLRSDSVRQRAGRLRATLSAWQRTDLRAAAARALAYLPPGAKIMATVYPIIKPRPNSFVWDTDTDPAIFLFLDPERTQEQFANTVAHELHHIGYASVRTAWDSIGSALPDSVRPLATWIGALGEGFAMLAAAGGPRIHPHASSPPADRARWDADLERFNPDLSRLDRFFQDILTRRLASPDSIRSAAMAFFGVQGPWYTVGWRMAVIIEERFGRSELLRCMLDPHRLLSTYNRAAAERNRARGDSLALWSPAVVESLRPPPA